MRRTRWTSFEGVTNKNEPRLARRIVTESPTASKKSPSSSYSHVWPLANNTRGRPLGPFRNPATRAVMDLISAGELEAAPSARSFCTLLRPKSCAVEAAAGIGVAAAGAAATGAALTGAAAGAGAGAAADAAAGAAAAGEEGGAFAEARPASLS